MNWDKNMEKDEALFQEGLGERIRQIEDEQKEYREYIESWVHEVKAPITSIDLMCENHKDDVTRRIRLENQKIENYVDMALYYARSDEV